MKELLLLVVLPLFLAEFTELSPILARHIIHLAVQVLPPTHRNRYRMEWLADLEYVPGKLNKLIWAFGTLFGACRMKATLKNIVATTEPHPLMNRCVEHGLRLSRNSELTLARQDFLSHEMGKRLQLSAEELEALRIGVYIHDLGKAEIPMEIIEKAGALTFEETRILRGHVLIGARMADKQLQAPRLAVEIAVFHHERYNGKGYPFGAKGDTIPRLARLFSVVDVYVALTEARPYKPAWPAQFAWQEIRFRRGEDFDPEMVDVLRQVLMETEWREENCTIYRSPRFGWIQDSEDSSMPNEQQP